MNFQGPFNSIQEVLKADSNRTGSLHKLKDDCFERFMYSKNLKIWLNLFKRNVLLIDSEHFKLQPILYLNELQKMLKLKQIVNFTELETVKNTVDYKVDNDTESLLQDYYSEDIKKLKNLVERNNLRLIAKWLQ